MENNADEKLVTRQSTISPSSLMVDFPVERFRDGYEAEAAQPEAPKGPQAEAAAKPEAAQAAAEAAAKPEAAADEAPAKPEAEAQQAAPQPELAQQPQPAPSAPWYCVLPILLFGATAALIPDSSADLRSSLGILLAFLSACTLAVGALSKRVRFRRGIFNIAFICCAAALVISYLLSPYRQTALFGAEDSKEGTVYLLSCVFIMFCAVNVMGSKAALKASVWTAAAVFAARGVFSALGYFGREIGRSDIILFSGGACLVFTLFAGQLALGRFTASVKSFVLWIVLAIFTAAAARTDLISFAASACAVIIILAALHFRTFRSFATPALLFILAAAFVLIPTWKLWTPEIKAQKMDGVSRVPIENIFIDGSQVYMVFEDSVLSAQIQADDDGRITKAEFTSGTGRPLILSEDKNEPKMFIIDEEPYHSFVRLCIIRDNDADLLRIETSGFAWNFLSDGSRLYCINSLGEADTPGTYKPREPAAGCRYIRERQAARLCVQDLSEKYAQYGCGADCFGIVCPPDRVYRYNCGLDASVKTEDPKSLYLLAGIQTGRVTLCAFAALFIIYAVLYVKGLRGERQFADCRPHRAAILAAILCLALSGITNSPKAGTLPLFFVLLGTGIAAEHKR